MAALFSGEPLTYLAARVLPLSCLEPACARYDIQANLPRNCCATNDETPLLDPELYRRLVIKQLNARLDGFKTLPARFDTCLYTWLAFPVLLLRRIGRQPTF